MNKEKTLSFLGLCQKAKKLVSGEAFSLEKIKNKEAQLVFLASDAGVNTTKRIKDKSLFYEIEVIEDFTTEELSKAIGKNNRKVIAILDKGFARQMKS
ncbi:MAG: YlxQ-related RNA-binding protein [Candidatus Izemoplasmatales bacterium]|jgi:ribosomal protein L7Ae-like RNA K-turn-binding protein